MLSGDDGETASRPFLQEDVMALKGLDLIAEQVEPAEPPPDRPEQVADNPSPVVQAQKPADKKTVKPKWLKM